MMTVKEMKRAEVRLIFQRFRRSKCSIVLEFAVFSYKTVHSFFFIVVVDFFDKCLIIYLIYFKKILYILL
jgi:hypothetical protein